MVKTLRDVRDDRIRAYIIWVPQYGGDIKGEANKLSRSFSDSRVSYFLDMEDLTGKYWEQSLKLGVAAWDVYLLYGASSRWEPELGAPDFWMHQLGGETKAPRFDQPEFESRLKEMLKAGESRESRESGESGESGEPAPRWVESATERSVLVGSFEQFRGLASQ